MNVQINTDEEGNLLVFNIVGLSPDTDLDSFTCLLTSEEFPDFSKEYDILKYIREAKVNTELLTIPKEDLLDEDTIYQLHFIVNTESFDVYYLDYLRAMNATITLAESIGLTAVAESDIVELKYTPVDEGNLTKQANVAVATLNLLLIYIQIGKVPEAYDTLIKLKNVLALWK